MTDKAWKRKNNQNRLTKHNYHLPLKARICAWTFWPSQLTCTDCPSMKSRSFSTIKRVGAMPVFFSSGKSKSAFEAIRLLVCLHSCLRDMPRLLKEQDQQNTLTSVPNGAWSDLCKLTKWLPLLYATLKVARIENAIFSLGKWSLIVWQSIKTVYL